MWKTPLSPYAGKPSTGRGGPGEVGGVARRQGWVRGTRASRGSAGGGPWSAGHARRPCCSGVARPRNGGGEGVTPRVFKY